MTFYVLFSNAFPITFKVLYDFLWHLVLKWCFPGISHDNFKTFSEREWLSQKLCLYFSPWYYCVLSRLHLPFCYQLIQCCGKSVFPSCLQELFVLNNSALYCIPFSGHFPVRSTVHSACNLSTLWCLLHASTLVNVEAPLHRMAALVL